MGEKIEVHMRPSNTLGSANHMWIVYTKSDGSQLSISGWSNTGGSITAGWGSLDVQVAKYGPQSWDYQYRNTELSQYTTTVAQGFDLSSTFRNMASEANRIDNANLAYGPLGVNSNSVVATILANAGLPPITVDSEIPGTGAPWVPGGSLDLESIFDLDKKYLPDEPGPDSTPSSYYTGTSGGGGGGLPAGYGGGIGGFNSGNTWLGGSSGRWVYSSVTVEPSGGSSGGTSSGWTWVHAYASRIVSYPVILDLGGNGLDLTSMSNGALFDPFQTGFDRKTGWFKGDDAMLVHDANGDGVVNGLAEISFLQHDENAASDLAALRAFDSNGDGFLSAADTQFGTFKLWQDHNYDGKSDASELHSLPELGVSSIGLSPDYGGGYQVEGNDVLGISVVYKADGTVSQAYDVGLQTTDRGAKVEAVTPEWTLLKTDTGQTAAVLTNGASTSADGSNFTINGILPDSFQFGDGNDTFKFEMAANDRSLSVDLGNGNNTLLGGSQGLTVTGGSGSDEVYGGTGNDVYELGGGYNRVREGGGDDTYIVKAGGGAIISDYAGTDTIYMDTNANQLVFNRTDHNDIQIYTSSGEAMSIYFEDMDAVNGIEFLVTKDRTFTFNEINDLAGPIWTGNPVFDRAGSLGLDHTYTHEMLIQPEVFV